MHVSDLRTKAAAIVILIATSELIVQLARFGAKVLELKPHTAVRSISAHLPAHRIHHLIEVIDIPLQLTETVPAPTVLTTIKNLVVVRALPNIAAFVDLAIVRRINPPRIVALLLNPFLFDALLLNALLLDARLNLLILFVRCRRIGESSDGQEGDCGDGDESFHIFFSFWRYGRKRSRSIHLLCSMDRLSLWCPL